jgi:hypothetical protein
VDGETLMTKKTKKTKRNTKSKFKNKDIDFFDIADEDEDEDDEEFDVAGTHYRTIRDSNGKIVGIKPIGGSSAGSPAPMDGPWSLDPPGPGRLQNLLDHISTASKFGFMKKGGQIKRTIKKRKKPRGVGKAVRGYGKAMK